MSACGKGTDDVPGPFDNRFYHDPGFSFIGLPLALFFGQDLVVTVDEARFRGGRVRYMDEPAPVFEASPKMMRMNSPEAKSWIGS